MSASLAETWSWSDHACRNCLGRLIRRDRPSAQPVFECGNCATTACGNPDGICGCGTLPRPSARSKPDAPGAPRFRCVASEDRAPGSTAPAVVVQWGVHPR